MPAGQKRAKLLLCAAGILLAGLFAAAILLSQPNKNRLKVQQQVKAYSQTNDKYIRKSVQNTLQGMGAEAAPYLVELIGYRESRWNTWIYELNQRIPALLRQDIESPGTIVGWRRPAAELICFLPNKQQSSALLVRLLEDDRPQVRYYVMISLSSLIQGTESDLLPKLLKRMENPIDQSNGLTPSLVAKFCDTHPEAIKSLEQLLAHKEEKLRLETASLLWTAKREHTSARKTVEQSFGSKDFIQQSRAARIYYSRTKDGAKVIPLHLKALSSTNWLDQNTALHCLKEMGTDARPVLAVVEPFLTNSNHILSNNAWQILDGIQPK